MKTPFVTTAGPRFRQFATTPVAVQAIVINEEAEILLLNSLRRQQGWQLVSGALEAEETLLAGTIRELFEETGLTQIRPLGLVHAETFRYDAEVPHMLSTYYLFLYEAGEVVPGDDMSGSEFRWWSLAELKTTDLHFHPSTKIWLLERAVNLCQLWREEGERPLQPPLETI